MPKRTILIGSERAGRDQADELLGDLKPFTVGADELAQPSRRIRVARRLGRGRRLIELCAHILPRHACRPATNRTIRSFPVATWRTPATIKPKPIMADTAVNTIRRH